MGKRNAGDVDRWIAGLLGGEIAKKLMERARIKDRKQDQKKGVQAKRLIGKRTATDEATK